MCGIMGYIGSNEAAPILLQGLERLEYRGYDSAGIAVVNGEGLVAVHKAPGKLSALVKSLNGSLPLGAVGIGHTRWATHGSPNEVNAHPHGDCNRDVVIVHNGIVENYLSLKQQLQEDGHVFNSQTDTEVIAHLVESFMAEGAPFEEAVALSAGEIKGAQAVVAMLASQPDRLVAFRLGNAGGITVGYGEGDMYLASDLPALLPYTSRVVHLGSGELAEIRPDRAIYRSLDNGAVERLPQQAPYGAVALAKGGFKHFMLKEIMEQPQALLQTLSGRVSFDPPRVALEGFPFSDLEIADLNRVVLTGMGTSLLAAQVGRHYIEKLTGLPAEVDNASELRYRDPVVDNRTLVVSVSQSGETVDTLAAIEEAARKSARQISVCNVDSSQATRIVDGTVDIGVGPEIGVATTKCFTGSIAALYLLATYLGRVRQAIDNEMLSKLLQDLSTIPRLMGQALEQEKRIEELAQKLHRYENFLYLGRGLNMPVAMEGALKLKEVSYIHAEGYPAGEMKHGPIALIDENMPVVVIAPRDGLYDKMRGNVEEVKARGGRIIAVVSEGDEDIAALADEFIEIPQTPELLAPIVSAVPLQMLAYHVAVRRGCDVDQPRNLAKTVTVE